MNHKTAFLYGVAIWAFAFLVAMFAFPFRETERAFFESIMPVSLVFVTTWATTRYFLKEKKRTFLVGLCLGLIWAGVSLGLDALLFSWGPMKMSLLDYLKDIGATYLAILIIPSGFGYILGKTK